ncbi:MAG: cytochrome B [Legionellales bacterium]|nr:cytochrome B [Legionellales bacterium]
MALRNTDSTYSPVTKFLHWILMIVVPIMLCVGAFMGDLPREWKGTVYNLHKLTGLTVLCIMILFVLWALINPKPKYPDSMAKWECFLACVTRYMLFAAVIIMPLSGWIMSTVANKLPHIGDLMLAMPGIPADKDLGQVSNKVHEFFGWLIFGLLVLHLLGALKHHFIDKNNILTRMVKF